MSTHPQDHRWFKSAIATTAAENYVDYVITLIRDSLGKDVSPLRDNPDGEYYGDDKTELAYRAMRSCFLTDEEIKLLCCNGLALDAKINCDHVYQLDEITGLRVKDPKPYKRSRDDAIYCRSIEHKMPAKKKRKLQAVNDDPTELVAEMASLVEEISERADRLRAVHAKLTHLSTPIEESYTIKKTQV